MRETFLPEKQNAFHPAKTDGAAGAHFHFRSRSRLSRIDRRPGRRRHGGRGRSCRGRDPHFRQGGPHWASKRGVRGGGFRFEKAARGRAPRRGGGREFSRGRPTFSRRGETKSAGGGA